MLYSPSPIWMPAGFEYVSLREGFDNRTPSGRLQMQIVLAFAEYELESIRRGRNQDGIVTRAIAGNQARSTAGYSPQRAPAQP